MDDVIDSIPSLFGYSFILESHYMNIVNRYICTNMVNMDLLARMAMLVWTVMQVRRVMQARRVM